jgi:hypothetical protein
MVRRLLIVMISVITTTYVHAQLLESDTSKWYFRGEGGLNWSGGNVERLLIRADIQAKHVDTTWGFVTYHNYMYGNWGKMTTENDYLSRNFLYLFPKRRLYPYMMVWLERNFRRRIDFRYQVGPGITGVLWRKPKVLLKLSTTATYEATDFTSNIILSDGTVATAPINVWRLTARAYGKLTPFNAPLHIGYEFWFQQSLAQSQNYRYYIEGLAEYRWAKHVAFKSQISLSHEQLTLRSFKKTDWYWTLGFSYTY